MTVQEKILLARELKSLGAAAFEDGEFKVSFAPAFPAESAVPLEADPDDEDFFLSSGLDSK